MSNIWEILGIDPTEDLHLIRRAYAERVKFCHPEDEPEAFQQLYQAYQEAIRQARTGIPEKDATEPKSKEPPLPQYDFDRLIARGLLERERDLWQYRADALTALRALGEDVLSCGSLPAWDAFLRSPVFLRVQHDTGFMALFIEYLIIHERLSLEIWARIYEAYHFRGMEQQRQKGIYTRLFSLAYPRYLQYRQKLREQRLRAAQKRQCLTWALYVSPLVIILYPLSASDTPSSFLLGFLVALGAVAFISGYIAAMILRAARKRNSGKSVRARRPRA